MSVDGDFDHRLAMNIWAGPNLAPAPEDMARMTRYTLNVHAPEVMKAVTGFDPNGAGLSGVDPTGTRIELNPAYEASSKGEPL